MQGPHGASPARAPGCGAARLRPRTGCPQANRVEPKPRPFSLAQSDRAQLIGVRVHRGAAYPEKACQGRCIYKPPRWVKPPARRRNALKQLHHATRNSLHVSSAQCHLLVLSVLRRECLTEFPESSQLPTTQPPAPSTDSDQPTGSTDRPKRQPRPHQPLATAALPSTPTQATDTLRTLGESRTPVRVSGGNSAGPEESESGPFARRQTIGFIVCRRSRLGSNEASGSGR
jgi:hypothetical protein